MDHVSRHSPSLADDEAVAECHEASMNDKKSFFKNFFGTFFLLGLQRVLLK
jgi:hypothetical protein